ncbi:8-oxoguanine glycosylase ogg1 [Yamadazyma tenuis]|uniref:N-glycosylase/DNA lyase n=1 Tax=Candida tenuis (strain ATCC 10573 / BCRC 21748 / CBS 615 / JCM 9827 / NBRC 10315 / NRRL Y-1498 / VKM Y-70) TaxID=590646 RepID=G3AX91_CANTC|nr:uncharacterized protein CANTEDRAFT_91890 [Yamadazyma tenuis ATCC 10573]EGV66719.1 hypothetical protein CANTEDRAFT_91890 [Yamadazyma tenuis ATCC 10573]WEJ95145.1 8-oxoguanine glycosylase ogg1 [Yamadazyma tenuis]
MTIDIVWKSLPLKPVELSLSRVLRCGQTFRWKNIDHVWSFTTSDRIVLLRQDEEHLHYSWIMEEDNKTMKPLKLRESETLEFIMDYFSLSTSLEKLYSDWSIVNQKYNKSVKNSPFVKFPGIRILRQDPWETTISFICSSNNNVKRISKMCDSLCSEFGKFINVYGGESFYSFPDPSSLAKPGTEQKLRELGFGYRARYIYNTACKFVDDDGFPHITTKTLHAMRKSPYEEAHEFLLLLDGVGPKVADCICLMALDKHEIVPVDTHVYQIAIRDYRFKGKRDLKTMNKQVYEDIRGFFKTLFGPYAGWAQSVLFASDLADLNNGINQITDTTTIKTEKVEVDKRTVDFAETKVVKSKRIKTAA